MGSVKGGRVVHRLGRRGHSVMRARASTACLEALSHSPPSSCKQPHSGILLAHFRFIFISQVAWQPCVLYCLSWLNSRVQSRPGVSGTS